MCITGTRLRLEEKVVGSLCQNKTKNTHRNGQRQREQEHQTLRGWCIAEQDANIITNLPAV